MAFTAWCKIRAMRDREGIAKSFKNRGTLFARNMDGGKTYRANVTSWRSDRSASSLKRR